LELVASATLIMSATYSQAIGTMYIIQSRKEKGSAYDKFKP
jgi:hypothetical protein